MVCVVVFSQKSHPYLGISMKGGCGASSRYLSYSLTRKYRRKKLGEIFLPPSTETTTPQKGSVVLGCFEVNF